MNTQKIFAGLIVLAIILIATAACAPAPTPTPTFASVTITDSANRAVTISAAPQRIVSLAPSTTEIAFALGLGNRIVAVDAFSDYPAETKDLPKIKTYPLNLEQVVALKPYLILAAAIQSPDDIKKLADLKLTVLVVGSVATTFDSVANDVVLVGKATGTEAKAKSVADALKQKVDAVKAKIANAQTKPRVYWELDATDPAKPYAPGPGSFISDIIPLAGGVSVTANAKSPYAQINAEEIIAANPDVIILSDSCTFYANPGCVAVNSVKTRPGWLVINAVKNDKVLPIDDNLVSRPGPRITDGLEAAAKLIHPELFK